MAPSLSLQSPSAVVYESESTSGVGATNDEAGVRATSSNTPVPPDHVASKTIRIVTLVAAPVSNWQYPNCQAPVAPALIVQSPLPPSNWAYDWSARSR